MQAAAILTLMLVVAAGLSIVNLHERVEKGAKANLAQLSMVLAEETSRSFQAIDLVLRNAIDHLAGERLERASAEAMIASRPMHEYLREKMAILPQVGNIIFIDAEGKLANQANSWPPPATSLAHREQFRYHRDNDTATLFVSEPVRNTADGAWTIYLARRVNDSRGKFLGVIQAAVRLAYFESFYRSVALPEGGSIALMREEGMVLARYPHAESMIGRVLGARRGGSGEAFVEGPDGVTRYVSFHAVPGFPLRVSIAMTREAVLGTWRRDAIVLALGAALAVATIMALLALLLRQIRNIKGSQILLSRQNEQLARSRKLLLEAQRIGKVGHWMSNAAGDTAVWSPQLFEMVGIPPQPNVPFSTYINLVHPDDVDNCLAERRRASDEGTALAVEHRLIRPDGSVVWVRMEAAPQWDAEGRFAGRFGIVQDISERKAAEQEIERSRLRLMDAIESLAEGFVLYDREDRFVMANTHYREMFPGLARVMKPGMSYEQIHRIANDQGILNLKGMDFEDWLKERMAWHYAGSKPLEIPQLDGRWIQIIDHRTSDGGTVGLRTDITAFKRIQAELEQKLADVQAIRNDLELQTQELVATSADLRSARDAAEAANRAKSDFLAIMSHEIRTPLGGMVGMVDLLRGTPLSDEQQRYTTLAKESADLLLGVINDILDFSKLEAGRLTPEAIDFDLRHLIEGLATVMTAKASERKLELRTALAPDLRQYLKGDPTRIRQILLNLVNNAIKFTERGSIEIGASQRLLPDGSIELSIGVRDTGIGMSPEVQKNVFDPFVQADTSISRKYGGSGLGLAICKQLCTMMGGRIGVDSTPGEGSTFWFTVKCGQGRQPVAAAPQQVAVVDRPLEILVAEDSPIIATLISSLLRKQGHRPTMVVNGAEAVAAASKALYDVVLMDVQMPEMDGISATKAIRNLPGVARDVPIVALTANALVGQRETYLAAGMNDYVTKPIQPPLLFAAINRWALRGADAPGIAGVAETEEVASV
ncbi:MAG: response regulator [Bradyrhizobium sp.]|nr:response regulator [Bradyrhizobium sp.]